MTETRGKIEQWVRRWGHPDESGERVWFTGEIHVHVEGQGMDVVVPIIDFAREKDGQIAALVAERDALRAALEASGGIRDDGLWHGAECPGVPAFECGCHDRRAALAGESSKEAT